MDTNEKTFEIVDGPSKDAIFDACKYAYHPRSIIVLDFEVVVGYTKASSDSKAAYIAMKIKDLRITSIEHEDGSGESFNLAGFCKADLDPYGTSAAKWHPYKFKAYYNTRYRNGAIVFSN